MAWMWKSSRLMWRLLQKQAVKDLLDDRQKQREDKDETDKRRSDLHATPSLLVHLPREIVRVILFVSALILVQAVDLLHFF